MQNTKYRTMVIIEAPILFILTQFPYQILDQVSAQKLSRACKQLTLTKFSSHLLFQTMLSKVEYRSEYSQLSLHNSSIHCKYLAS